LQLQALCFSLLAFVMRAKAKRFVFASPFLKLWLLRNPSL
jgi:hypothetical protein